MDIVRRTFTHRDGARRVEIFERSNGTFGFEELSYSNEEATWFPVGKYSVAIVDSVDAAVTEARGRVRWLTDDAEQIVGREPR